jgi:two-component system, cell cycle response regulator
MSGDDEGAEKTIPALPLVERAPARQTFLVVLSGPQCGEAFDLEPGRESLIGRGPVAEVRLADEGVSRRHALITMGEEEARLVDAGSANGTFVGGARVSEAALRDGACVHLGAHTVLALVCPTDPARGAHERALADGVAVDPATGLYTCRHLAARLRAEVAAAQRHRRALAVLLADVDHLRRVNEARGAAAGDEALRMVAAAFQATVRSEDVLGRVAGEELAVVARETGLTGAKALAERLRRAVERSRRAFQGAQIAATVTIGVAVTTGLGQFEAARGDLDLLAAARRALARAKRNGVNTVFAGPAVGG